MKSWVIIVIAVIMGIAQSAFSVTFTNVTTAAHLNNFHEARGAAWVDYDRDGYLDLFLGSEQGRNRLHRNLGNGTFENVTTFAGIPQRSGVWGVNFADIDNDGYDELYMSTRAPDTVSAGRNVLLRNSGQGDFIDISASSGADVTGGGIAACFAPFGKGNFIDLFVPNQYYPTTQFPVMLENAGSCIFTDNTNFYGLYQRYWWDVPIAFDYDNDTEIELFCTKDFDGNSMYDRENGHAFIDVTADLHIQTPCGYGATVGDVNNDGWSDLYITNWHDYTDNLFIYDSVHTRYYDLTDDWNVHATTWTSAAHFADFDNDGWLDLFVTGAATGNNYYRNNSGQSFTNCTSQAGLTNGNYNWGASIGDYNNDGFLDIFTPEYYQGSGGRLYRNNGNSNHWVKVQLHGINSNRDGIGARITIQTPTSTQYREVIAGSGFGSQNSLIQHFGLGLDSIITRMTVSWPGLGSDDYDSLGVDVQYEVTEGYDLSIGDNQIQKPISFAISNAYPNPFNGTVNFEIEAAEGQFLNVEIYDILGNKVKTLYSARVQFPRTRLSWNSEDNSNAPVASGVYFCRITDGVKAQSRKVLLLK
jgi:enediyne biosynthesis protein E4